MLLLDTHVLLWLETGVATLGPRAQQALDNASWRDGEVGVSAISFWELAMLVRKGRLDPSLDPAGLRDGFLDDGLVEVPVNGAIGIRAEFLDWAHRDPADRIIVATALEGHELLTSDEQIRKLETWIPPRPNPV